MQILENPLIIGEHHMKMFQTESWFVVASWVNNAICRYLGSPMLMQMASWFNYNANVDNKSKSIS